MARYKVRVKGKSAWLIALVVAAVLIVYSGYYVFLYLALDSQGGELKGVRSGTFGDAFGVINALFSGFAFSGVILTLILQRQELEETRQQIAHQNFESQFYSTLSHHKEIVSSFDLQDEKTHAITAQGRDCFRFWDKYLSHKYNVRLRLFPSDDAHTLAYEMIYKHFRSDFRLYFRSLYSLLKLVDECEHPNKEYFKFLVCSLITDYELKFIFYNSLTAEGEKLARYVNRFSLFENLDYTMLLKREHINFYGVAAYGSNKIIIDKLKVSCQ